MKPAICTQCGANITVDETFEAGICPVCGTAFITEKAINNYSITNTTINNNQTAYNINETVTKIIMGNEKDEADDFFKRGLMHLNFKEYLEASTNFKNAINISPNNGIYRFYLVLANSNNFEEISRLFSHNFIYRLGRNPNDAFEEGILHNDLYSAIKLLSNEEKIKIFTEFNIDLSSDTEFVLSIIQKVFSNTKTPNVRNYEFIEKIYRGLSQKQKNKILECLVISLKTQKFEQSYIKYIVKLFDTIKDDISSEDFILIKRNLKNYVNYVKDGIYYIDDERFLDIDKNGTLIYPNNIYGINVDEKATVNLKNIVKRIYVLPSLTNITTNSISRYGIKAPLPCVDIIEFDKNCSHDQVIKILPLGIKMVILPENIGEVIKDYFNSDIRNFQTILVCRNPFKNNISVEYDNGNKLWHFASIMDKNVFFPFKERNNFEKNIVDILGEDFLINKNIYDSVSPIYAYENNKNKDWNLKIEPKQVVYSKEPEFIEYVKTINEQAKNPKKSLFNSIKSIFNKNK